MALTPEDVVNKRFQTTKFKEGYDQDDVDDFLDEVVVELRRLGQENEELRQRLIASEARVTELESGAPAAPVPAATSPAAAPEPTAIPEPAPVFAPEPVPAAGTPATGYQAPGEYHAPEGAGLDLDPSNTNNLLQLARRLHEEHVREGMEKRDQLIAEGEAQAARLAAEAEEASAERIAAAEQESSERIAAAEKESAEKIAAAEQESTERIAAAEEASRTAVATLEQERVGLEAKVEGLRGFEREYREKLRGYIQAQLDELEAGDAAPASAEATPSSEEGDPSAESEAAPFAADDAEGEGEETEQQQPAAAPGWAAPQSYAPAEPSASRPSEYPGFGDR